MGDNGTSEPTKDLTENLTDRQLLLLLLERVTSIDERVIRLEAAEEERKKETRPLWERLEGQMTHFSVRLAAIEERLTAIEERLTAIEAEQRRMRIEIGLLREDLYQEKMQRGYLAERVTEIEKQLRAA